MKKYIPVLFILLLLSCELFIDVDVPLKHSQLTVNSIFNPDSVWSAEVSLNRFILNDSPFQKVENGLVVIYHDGLPIDTLTHQKNGIYKSDSSNPLIGTEYEIKVSSNDYESIVSKSSIPFSPAKINDVKIVYENPNSPYQPPVTTFNIKFMDPPNEVNYYKILVEAEYEFYDQLIGTVSTRRYRVFLQSNDPANKSGDENLDDGIMFNDVLFNGKDAKISFKAPFYLNTTIFVILHTASEDYYKYLTTKQLQNNTVGDPFAQPANVFNNIKNGFGIFAGYSQSVFVKESPRPSITNISPTRGKRGDRIIISGENFITPGVSFNADQYAAYSNIVSSTANEIEVIIPDRAITGKIVVYAGGYVVLSDLDFEIIN